MENGSIRKEVYNYEENSQLIPLAKAGNQEAMNKVIEMNLPLVSSISKKFLNRGYDYEDIFQIGSIGLVKAINNFDEKFNVKFSTYAVPMIIGEIKRFIRDDGIIKVSRNVKSLARKLHFDKEELTKKGYKIDKKQIVMDNNLASLGFHNVNVVLYKDVTCKLKVQLVK